MKPIVLSISMLTAAFIAGAGAVGDDVLTKAEKKLAEFHEKYQATGTVKNCVSLRAIRDSQVFDNQTIVFKGRGKTAYINRLPRTCTRLAVEQRFSYTTSMGQLCHTNVITVLDGFGRSWTRCGLGKFEEWERKPSDKAELSG